MTEPSSAEMPALPPPIAVLQMIGGYWITRMLYVVTDLGIADLIDERPRPAAELADATGVHPRALYRVLRALAGVGIFVADDAGNFHLTPIGATLRRNAPDSMRAMVLSELGGEHFEAWTNLEQSVKTGEIAFDHKYAKDVWAYYAETPERAAIFNESMTNVSENTNAAVVAAYDFSSIQKIVDVAGGHGSLLAGILSANPHLHGVLFDQPHVVNGADDKLAGFADRCEIVGGNMFEEVPSGGDAYIMKWIIHDWNDERSLVILNNIHRAMLENGKLLLVEMVVPPGNEMHFAKLIDINMLVMTGGCERTETEYKELLAQAGFKLTRIVPTEGPASVIEAIRI
ncbi:MAG TPA: methyltransferase [Blastocatellia bacterium]|nr:methyltransferase [Blastocatellia bacterium]